MADTLRGSMDAAAYQHVVLGLIFLKYISDAFEERHAALVLEEGQGADPEDPDEYRADNIFWVPPEARWANLRSHAKQATIGELVDTAMEGVERDNPALKGVLPKDYARPVLDEERLGQIIDLISNIRVGDEEGRSKDVLGRLYEYFLSQFASAEGKKGGEFYTPRSVVKLLVEMLEPYRGRVYDPCCGSAGMFIQSVEFIRAHANGNGNGGRAKADISIYGQESNYTTWRLARMNLAIRGIDGQIAHGDTFHNDQHPDLKADHILANPPFNISGWGGERLRDDKRWQYGTPPARNANFAWVQHIVHHLAPAGVVDIIAAAGLRNPDISVLSDEFLAEVRGMPQRNLAVELLEKLLKGEMAVRRKKNVVQARSFADMLERTIHRYQSRAIEAAQVIEERIELAKRMRDAGARGEALGLSDEELAFYDALATNDAAVAVLGDETLRHIAQELVETVRKNVTIDWTLRENVQANLRRLVKRVLRKHGYPPDKQEKATQTVLEQAALLSGEWAA